MKEFIFNIVSDLQPATLLKNELLQSYFLKILTSFQEHLFKTCSPGVG